MKKNGFLTFCFAFIPGAGQMYQGYMKRGLSLISIFCVGIMISAIFSYATVLLPIVWMYSFFDTFNLRSAPYPVETDQYLIPVECLEKGKAFVKKRPTLVGAILILLGVWTLFDTFVAPILSYLAILAGVNEIYYYTFYRNLPALAVALAIIYAGFRLAFGKSNQEEQDFEEFRGGNYNDEAHG